MVKILSAALVSLFLFASASHAGSACFAVTGFVQSVPDETCAVKQTINNDPEEWWLPPALSPSPVCFKITGGSAMNPDGTVDEEFSGYSALTATAASNLILPFLTTLSPFDFRRTERAQMGLTGFTSRAVLSGRFALGDDKVEGSLYTRDTGVITPDGFVGQVLLIVGGTEGFEGATGRIGVAGQELPTAPPFAASFNGEICLPED